MNDSNPSTLSNVADAGGWYDGLDKPAWNPPAWLFGPAWTLLYAAMAVAAWLVWKQGGWQANRAALGLFAVQLLLNVIWSPLFFRLHRPDLALIDCALLTIAVGATMVAFWRVNSVAGALFVPYLAWVCFATALNFSIWKLNR